MFRYPLCILNSLRLIKNVQKISGVSPINKDWSVEDCLRFQDMVIEKNFVSIIENVESDPLHTNESLLTLNLIDTSTDSDVYVNKLLSGEGRAKLKYVIEHQLFIYIRNFYEFDIFCR